MLAQWGQRSGFKIAIVTQPRNKADSDILRTIQIAVAYRVEKTYKKEENGIIMRILFSRDQTISNL